MNITAISMAAVLVFSIIGLIKSIIDFTKCKEELSRFDVGWVRRDYIELMVMSIIFAVVFAVAIITSIVYFIKY